MLGEVQRWLAADPADESRLAVITRGAVAAVDGDAVASGPGGLAGAAVWGLMRSAQAEEPGRFVLVDTDGSAASAAALTGAITSGEPQVAVRRGQVLIPRLAPLQEPGDAVVPYVSGTVLVTGGTGTLGGLVAHHLVARHGVRELTLASRRGAGAAGAARLAAKLAACGATVRVAVCDAADRDTLAGLLNWVGRPLGGVVHCAGALDDGAVGSLTAQRLDAVLRPKADAAWHLHELTTGMDLGLFVLFSSAAGVLGTPGQANYAAANAFLDALVAWRRGQGLAGLSLGWGLWQQASGMTGHLGQRDLARMRRLGIAPLTSARGLEPFDAAVAGAPPAVVAARLDATALGASASEGTLPAVLADLVSRSAETAAVQDVEDRSPLAKRLAGLDTAGQRHLLVETIRSQAAAVLGHDDAGAVDTRQAFRDLGFDSMTAIELRNRLTALTGLRLPAALAFDYPTPAALAAHLHDRILPGAVPARAAATPVTVADSSEPLAVVGVGCRFPGGVGSAEELWDLIAGETDAIGGFPADRGWDAAGGSYARRGGFVYEAAEFDAGFFGISPREALAMDPQQRLLLECAWQALEDAGIDPASLRGTDTGVFAGVIPQEYGPRWLEAGEGEFAGFVFTGTAGSVTSGRVSYAFGLEGPAVSVDTACSSSLVALHLAGQALRRGECSLALAGGATVIAEPGGVHSSSSGRGAWPATVGASPSRRRRTESASRRARGCWWWSGCRTRCATGGGSWGWWRAAR